MDAATIRRRLQAEGIAVKARRDGTLIAGLLKARDESWSTYLRSRVEALPGAVVTLVRERPSSDPWLQHTEVLFRMAGSSLRGAA